MRTPLDHQLTQVTQRVSLALRVKGIKQIHCVVPSSFSLVRTSSPKNVHVGDSCCAAKRCDAWEWRFKVSEIAILSRSGIGALLSRNGNRSCHHVHIVDGQESSKEER